MARILYVGQFIPRKGVADLVNAFRDVTSAEAELTLLGYGPMEDWLRRECSHRNMSNVRFAGPTTSPEETAKYYWENDILVLPSRSEVWGLVVNEALAAGLVVIVSDAAGCAEDLVCNADVRVGRTFVAGNVQHLRRTILESVREVRTGVDREAISAWGLQHTPEKYATAVGQAIRLGLRTHGRH